MRVWILVLGLLSAVLSSLSMLEGRRLEGLASAAAWDGLDDAQPRTGENAPSAATRATQDATQLARRVARFAQQASPHTSDADRHPTTSVQAAKTLARRFANALDRATPAPVASMLPAQVEPHDRVRSVHPCHKITGSAHAVAPHVLASLQAALPERQVRSDSVIAGCNDRSEAALETWVMTIDHILGRLDQVWHVDQDWPGISRTHTIAMFCWAEFPRINAGRIPDTGRVLHVIGLMAEASGDP